MSNGKLTRRNLITLLGGATAGLLAGCKESPYGVDASPLPEAATKPQLGMPGDLYFLSLGEVSRLIEARSISPLELTQGILDRISTLDRQLMSYVTVTADRAIEAAGKAEEELAAGIYRGPLHGIPVAAKDLFYSKATHTMGGLAVHREFVPKFDATVLERLEDAGAILVGKLNLTEGAMGGYHPDFEIPRNPWRKDLWPGASSCRAETHLRSGQPARSASAGTDDGPRGADDPFSNRRRDHASGHGGARYKGPDFA
jgi:amidase